MFDWSGIARVSKALTAGCTGAATSAIGVGVTYWAVPATTYLPAWLWTGLPVGAAAFGFLSGFAATFAVSNSLPKQM